jgi:hypothetical protein
MAAEMACKWFFAVGKIVDALVAAARDVYNCNYCINLISLISIYLSFHQTNTAKFQYICSVNYCVYV